MSLTPRQQDFRLQIIFTFITVYAGLLFALRPDPTRGQVIFRASLAVVGLLGLGYVAVRKRKR